MSSKSGQPSVAAHEMRKFETGATRNVDENKNDYEGFISPLVLEGYGDYMTRHRIQADGSVRASDNWQKGIPMDAYQKSLIRHVMTAWLLWDGHKVKPEQVGTESVTPTLEDALYAILFNAMGMIHELRKGKANQTAEADWNKEWSGILKKFEESLEKQRDQHFNKNYWPITQPWKMPTGPMTPLPMVPPQRIVYARASQPVEPVLNNLEKPL